jgi:CDP-paratose 2-epimerase
MSRPDRAAEPSRGHRPVLVTGGAGFLGCHLADRLAREGWPVIVLDSLVRHGVRANLDWLLARHRERISVIIGDIREAQAAELVKRCGAVFHLAGQVAVTTSLAAPAEDLDVNMVGTLRLLEAARACEPKPAFLFASTNKVYGALANLRLKKRSDRYVPEDAELGAHGIAEDWPLDFRTPYGCSKGAADQYVRDYARCFGLPTVAFRMSCVYGPRQCGTEDQGWVAHFARAALAGEPITLYGDGCQMRDLLYVEDAVEAYIRAFLDIDEVAGDVFNLGGGPANAVSLIELITHLEELTGRRLSLRYADWRAGDQRYFVSDSRRAMAKLALAKPTDWREGTRRLVQWLMRERHGAATASGADPSAKGQAIAEQAS